MKNSIKFSIAVLLLLTKTICLDAQGIMIHKKNGSLAYEKQENISSIQTIQQYESPYGTAIVVERADGNSISVNAKNFDYIECNALDYNHEAVDLGLSVLWATCNVGADKPECFGNYYAFCETYEKAEYTKENYHTKSSSNTDAASYAWGGKWRIPKQKEMDELCKKCTWTYTSRNGIDGYEAKGPNGNSIFLPTAGYYCPEYSGTLIGHYATTNKNEYGIPYTLLLNPWRQESKSLTSKEHGISIRPVMDK